MVQIEGLDRLLAEHPFFRDMGASAQATLAGCAANERFDAGQFIFKEGQAANKVYLIRHGVVSLELHPPGKEPVMLETLHDGDVLGWSWLVPPYRWSFDARAVQLCRLVSLDATCLRPKLESDHSLGYELFKRFIPVMGNRLAAARLQLLDMYGRPPISFAPAPAPRAKGKTTAEAKPKVKPKTKTKPAKKMAKKAAKPAKKTAKKKR